MSTGVRVHVSEAEFLSLPETTDHVELIDGEVFVSPSPSFSRNRGYDRVTKRFVYAEAGVREYWIVDPSGTVERSTGSGLGEATELTERLETPLLPGLVVDLRALFRHG